MTKKVKIEYIGEIVECVEMDVRTEAQAEGIIYEKAH